MRNILLTIVLLSMVFTLSAQEEGVTVIQPDVIVIPYTKEGQDIRTILDNSPNLRIAITKVKEGFDQRGFNTIDFLGRLKAVTTDQAFEMTNQQSLKQMLVENSGADIYVEVDGVYNESSSGSQVTVTLNAYDAFSGESMGSKVMSSGKFYTTDVAKLATKAVGKGIDPFLNTMQEKFEDIIENGRVVTVSFTFDEGSEYNMDYEIGEDELPLSDVIEEWYSENSFKNSFSIRGVVSTKMQVEDRIPLKDDKGRNYRPSKYALKVYKYIKSLGMSCKKDVNGTKIYITIN